MDVAIATNMPTVTGTVTSWSITPNLPSGLMFNAGNGEITGTATAAAAQAMYTATAANSSGSTQAQLDITVDLPPPPGVTYAPSNPYTVGFPIMPLVPTVTGVVTKYSLSGPQLPPGLTQHLLPLYQAA